jgi:hypothetical protein
MLNGGGGRCHTAAITPANPRAAAAILLAAVALIALSLGPE